MGGGVHSSPGLVREGRREAALTEARLCEELERLLGAMDEIPLMVSLLRLLGLIICLPESGPGRRAGKAGISTAAPSPQSATAHGSLVITSLQSQWPPQSQQGLRCFLIILGRRHLLFLSPTPFQVVGGEGQSHTPQGSGEQNFLQAG